MLELAALSDFHFLRPIWLVLVPVAVGLYVLLRKERDQRTAWQRLIAPHLLEHLLVGTGGQARFRPEHLIALIVGIGGLALSGPTWVRERPPFADDQGALVVAIDASQTMNAVDVPPTRLERAKLKVKDLLAARPGAKTALVAYAGSAHVALPLTEDVGILEMYLEAIASEVMPDPASKRAADAYAVAADLLARQETPGSVLFLTDAFPPEDRAAVAARAKSDGAPPILVLGIGTSRGGPIRTGKSTFATDASGDRVLAAFDVEGFEALSREAGAYVTTVTVDDSDVRRITRKARQDFADVQAESEGWRWKDLGWYLVFPVVLLVALWFRRGWTVRWAAVLALAAAALAGTPAHAHDSAWQDLWKTKDQQGRWHYERGEFADAAAHFEDPLWRGIALYGAERYDEAIESWAALDTEESWFRQGNAYARLERWDDAIRAYERAPGVAAAAGNLELVRQLKAQAEKEDEEEPAEGGDTLGADEIVEADPNDKRKRPEVEETTYGAREMDESMAEVWMRQVQTTPAAFLRAKFAIQAAGERGREAPR